MLDFLILDSVYKTSVRRQWQPDDRFCSLIDNAYWHGKVISREPFRYVKTSSNAGAWGELGCIVDTVTNCEQKQTSSHLTFLTPPSPPSSSPSLSSSLLLLFSSLPAARIFQPVTGSATMFYGMMGQLIYSVRGTWN